MKKPYWELQVKTFDDEIVKRSQFISVESAKRLEKAININLNHDGFYTDIVRVYINNKEAEE